MTSASILTAGPGVGAILLDRAGRYLLQQRDDFPHIWFPGCWGLFGGAIDPGETALEGLRRELGEEIGVAPRDLRYFMRIDTDFGFAGGPVLPRDFYEGVLDADEIAALRLGEGRAMRFFAAGEMLKLAPMTPYDGFGLFLHANRARIRAEA